MTSGTDLCPAGRHPASDVKEARDGRRFCRTCRSEDAKAAAQESWHSLDGKTHCRNGHDLAKFGLKRKRGRRYLIRCGQCERERGQRSRKGKTHCRNGHLFAKVGFKTDHRNRRHCAACVDKWAAKNAEKRRRQRESEWFDWVVVERVGRGVPLALPGHKPRKITKAEFDECMRRYYGTMTVYDLARRMGVGESRIRGWVERNEAPAA